MRNLSAASTKPSVTRKFMTRRFMSSLRILTSRSFRSHSSRVTTFFEDAMEAGESIESRSRSTMRERNIRRGGQGRDGAGCWSGHIGAISLRRRAARWRARVSPRGGGSRRMDRGLGEKPRMSRRRETPRVWRRKSWLLLATVSNCLNCGKLEIHDQEKVYLPLKY